MSGFSVPTWSSKPCKPVSIEMLQNGVIIEEIHIDLKETYLLGRNNELCDYAILHNSISRKHAVIQHGMDNKTYIFDLSKGLIIEDSTHGTFVNKKKISPGTFHEIFSGDFIFLGMCPIHLILKKYPTDSTDEETESSLPLEENEEIQRIKEFNSRQDSRSQYSYYEELLEEDRLAKGNIEIVHDRTQVNWGMVDDAVIYSSKNKQDEIIRTDILKRLPNLTPKQLAKIEKFEKKLRKLESLKKDYNRSFDFEKQNKDKESETKRLRDEIDKRMNKLANELDTDENQLKKMFGFPEEDEFLEARKLAKQVSSDEEDEFYNRTIIIDNKRDAIKTNNQPPIDIDSESLSYSDLIARLNSLSNKRISLNEHLLSLLSGSQRSKEMDSLDSFMAETNSELSAESKKHTIQSLKKANKDYEETLLLIRSKKADFDIDEFNAEIKHKTEQKQKEIQAKEKRRNMLILIEQRNQELERQRLRNNCNADDDDGFIGLDEEEEREMLGKRLRRGIQSGKEQESCGVISDEKKLFYGAPMKFKSIVEEEQIEEPIGLNEDTQVRERIIKKQQEFGY